MKRILRYLCPVLVIALLLSLALFSPSAQAADPQLTRLAISFNGQTEPFGFKPGQLEYKLDYTSAAPVEVSVTAQAAEGYALVLNGERYSNGAGSQTETVSDRWIIEIQVINGVHTANYKVTVNITPPPDAGDGNENGGNDNGNSGQNGSGSSGNSGSDNGNSGQSGNNGDDSGGMPAADPDGPAAPAAPDPEEGSQPGPAATHLILYIGAPFLLVDDVYLPADTAPYLVTDANGGGYTMVPVRFIAEALGAEVSWDAVGRKVGIDLDGRYFELVIGQLVPGTPVAATIRDSRTFVPLRYVMESFGAEVSWTQREQRIDIYYTPKPETK